MQRVRLLLTPWRAAALALLLLAVQALGLAHRIAHGPVLPALAHASAAVDQPSSDIWGHARAAVAPAHSAHEQTQDHSHGYSHDRSHDHDHDASAECRHFDQLLGQVDVLPVSELPPPLPVPAAQQLARSNQATGRAATAPYQARAPPLA